MVTGSWWKPGQTGPPKNKLAEKDIFVPPRQQEEITHSPFRTEASPEADG